MVQNLSLKYQKLQNYLKSMGSVAVAFSGIELMPQEFEKLMQEDVRKTVYAEFKSFGFSYVTLDLMGYRTGSMNETLDEQK